jgi:hypothetical protein
MLCFGHGYNAKEFIDFWMQNSVHAKLDLGQLGSSQIAADLAARLLIAAKDQGLSEDEVRAEIGDPIEFIRSKLGEANAIESERRHPNS